MVAIAKYERGHILEAVQLMYTQVATEPDKTFHFPTGRPACEFVGYPAEELDAVLAQAVESFAGVGYPFAADAVREGDHVLDIGSGSGTDALIAVHRTGPRGKVYGLDMTQAMRAKLRRNAYKPWPASPWLVIPRIGISKDMLQGRKALAGRACRPLGER